MLTTLHQRLQALTELPCWCRILTASTSTASAHDQAAMEGQCNGQCQTAASRVAPTPLMLDAVPQQPMKASLRGQLHWPPAAPFSDCSAQQLIDFSFSEEVAFKWLPSIRGLHRPRPCCPEPDPVTARKPTSGQETCSPLHRHLKWGDPPAETVCAAAAATQMPACGGGPRCCAWPAAAPAWP